MRRKRNLVMHWARWDKTGRIVDARYREPDPVPEPEQPTSRRGVVAQGALDL